MAKEKSVDMQANQPAGQQGMEAEGGGSVLGAAARGALGALKWTVDEVVMPAAERAIPHGASEIASVLYTGSGFVQYGAEGFPPQEAHAPAEAEPSYEEAQAAWQEHLRASQERGQGIGH